MANIVLGSIVADIRGSVGTETYSRGPGGLVVKARPYPDQPESTKRDDIQDIFSAVTKAWSGRLTAAQREAWRAYGHRFPRPNRFGEQIIVSGYLAFVRCNCTLKLLVPVWWFDDPPELGMLPMPALTITASFTEVNVVDITLAPYVSFLDSYFLIISAGKTTNAGVSYYSTPWRIVQTSYYLTPDWIPALTAIEMPVWCGTKARFWLKAVMFDRNSGRVSMPFFNSCIVD